VPAAPINLTATASGTDKIILSWFNGNDSICVDSYSAKGVETLSNKGVLTISTIVNNATAVSLTPGVNYTFTVTAVNKKGTSSPATITYMIPKPEPVCNIKPASPVNVTAIPASDTKLLISWLNGNDSICVGSYNVEGVETVSGKSVLKGSTISNNISAVSLTPGVNYTFTITAVNKIGTSLPTTITYMIPKPEPVCNIKPASPVNVTAIPASDTKMLISWLNGNDSICVGSYNVEGVETVSGKSVLKGSTISNNISAVSLTPGVNYTFTITAVNKNGQSESVKITTSIPKPYGPAGCTDDVPSKVSRWQGHTERHTGTRQVAGSKIH
jgi:predicted Rdx family selenoprotein